MGVTRSVCQASTDPNSTTGWTEMQRNLRYCKSCGYPSNSQVQGIFKTGWFSELFSWKTFGFGNLEWMIFDHSGGCCWCPNCHPGSCQFVCFRTINSLVLNGMGVAGMIINSYNRSATPIPYAKRTSQRDETWKYMKYMNMLRPPQKEAVRETAQSVISIASCFEVSPQRERFFKI